jgi:aerobic-type carbon monoxide dehydrogenase small subunit (CoxS/CutS family)
MAIARHVVNVNGVRRTVEADGDMPLLWALRDHLNLTGSKYGCGAGLCGACTVHVDGSATRSCQMRLADTAKKAITTIEGLSKDGTHPLQKAWIEHDVPQCGYCQAGHLMQAADLLRRVKAPSDADIDEAFRGLVCRCGTQPRIKKAVLAVARAGGKT